MNVGRFRFAVRAAIPALVAVGALSSCESIAEVTGTVMVDGSTTLNPMAQQVVKSFQQKHPKAIVNLKAGGTSVGFDGLCSRAVDIALASRPIKPVEEEYCQARKVDISEFVVANDAVGVFVHPANPHTCVSLATLKKMWVEKGSTEWSEVDPLLPAEKIMFFAPEELSGTSTVFSELVIEQSDASRPMLDQRAVIEKLDAVRPDVDRKATGTEVAKTVAQERRGVGFASVSSLGSVKVKTLALKVTEDGECVLPSEETVRSGAYPLSRELFIYARKGEMGRPEVEAFLDEYLSKLESYAKNAQLVPLVSGQKDVAVQQLASLKHTAEAN
jgi:phosphate transport system substrate-binding protein